MLIEDRGELLRTAPWLVFACAGIAAVYVIAPYQLGVLLWLATKASTGVVVGHLADWLAFPGARPRQMADSDQANKARLRRAIVIGACVLGFTLGV